MAVATYHKRRNGGGRKIVDVYDISNQTPRLEVVSHGKQDEVKKLKMITRDIIINDILIRNYSGTPDLTINIRKREAFATLI